MVSEIPIDREIKWLLVTKLLTYFVAFSMKTSSQAAVVIMTAVARSNYMAIDRAF